MVGLSTYPGYNYNERAMVSLAIVNNDVSMPGTEILLVWGEEGPRHDKADRRTSRTGGDPGNRRAGADFSSRARGISAEGARVRENP